MFASDNWAGAADAVMAELARASEGRAPAYGGDPWTSRAEALIAEFFEHEVAVFFTSTGSAANALALATYSKPAGVVFCHVDAHVARDEAGAPVFFAHGTSMDGIDGPAGKIDPAAFARRLEEHDPAIVHFGQAAAVSLTNVNEIGQCYTPAEVAEIARIARTRGLAVHMDGARFSNALVATGASPAGMTWQAGVDVLSFGLTKTGAWCAEVVVLFDPGRRQDAMFRHKQAAQQYSKNRFTAAQVCALLEGRHCLALAGHANAMASALGEVLEASGEAVLAYPPASNEVFAFVSPAGLARLESAGVQNHGWLSRSAHLPAPPQPDWTLRRFVASFRSTTEDVDAVRAALGERQAA